MTLDTDQNPDGPCLPANAHRFSAMRDAVLARWEREARVRVEGADAMSSAMLSNGLAAFYDNIAEALSPLHPRQYATSDNNAAWVHGGERARLTSFAVDQVAHEYQILREAIELEAGGRVDLSKEDWMVIDRSINRGIREAMRGYVAVREDERDKIAAALSHDMRTPLGLMVNGAELMKTSRDLDTAKRFACKIEAHGRRLEGMMAELLDALTSKRFDRLPLELTRFDIADLIEHIQSEYAEVNRVPIRTRIEHVEGHWSADALRRALENLVNNAAQYGDGTGVDIAAASNRGRLMLSVRNTGAPIPKSRLNQLFERPADCSAPFTAGWGLGLPYVRLVAENHGGSVVVDSCAETGTTFLIDIPIDSRPYSSNATCESIASPWATP